jgi:glutamate racemase
MQEQHRLPIGVFDSGLGGLTVVRAIRQRLPQESIIYLGDNARVPYGTRSKATIERYARNCAEFLIKQGLKMMVVACNTVSAVALPVIAEQTSVPLLGVIAAGARAVTVAGAPRIGVIGTVGTIKSNAYLKQIAGRDPTCVVFQKPAPLLVPLAEEGWISGDVPRAVATHYLKSLVEEGIEILLLGCTHYPLLADTIREVLGELGSRAIVVDSASSMAADVQQTIERDNLRTDSPTRGTLECFVTDLPDSFEEVATRFLGERPEKIFPVDLS